MTPDLANPVDPIVTSVIQHRLLAIVEEMGEAMLRTSYSQILNSSRDFSTAICDLDGRLIAQAEHVPIHVGALPFAAQAMTEFFGDDIHQGDVFLLNDPYHGGNHLPDLTAFVPVFAGGRRLLWTVVRAHQSDIGGATHGAYNPDATEIWQEGLRIPPIKLYEAGRLRDDILDMIALNTRNEYDFRGDLAAMIGAAHLGERRMQKLFAELTAPMVEAAIEGAVLRLRPIMMTMLVATLGLMPAALSHGIGSDSQRPFAIVIVGGLLANLVIGVFLLPTLYVMFAGDNDVLPKVEIDEEF